MAIPFMGFASKSAYVLDRHRNGSSLLEIVAESKIEYGVAASIISVYRSQYGSILKDAAKKRDISLAALKNKLLDIIEKENLIDAILDDADELKQKKHANGTGRADAVAKGSVKDAPRVDRGRDPRPQGGVVRIAPAEVHNRDSGPAPHPVHGRVGRTRHASGS